MGPALTFLLLAPAATAQEVELVWRPEPGSVLAREIEFEVQGGLRAEFVGAAGSVLGPWCEVTITGRLQVRDELLDIVSGRPTSLLRDYERVSTVWNGLARHEVLPEWSSRPMRFDWDEEAGGWRRTWAGAGLRTDEPPALREDLDLRAFLPDRSVRVGDVWRVPVSSVAGALAPVGGLHLDESLSEAWGFDELGRAFDLERVRRVRDGEVQCKFERIERVDGRRLAVIEVGWTWWGTIDPFLTPAEGTWLAHLLPEGIPAHLDGRAWGRLLWDLQGGHAREFELQAELGGYLGSAAGSSRLPIHARGAWFMTITPR